MLAFLQVMLEMAPTPTPNELKSSPVALRLSKKPPRRLIGELERTMLRYPGK